MTPESALLMGLSLIDLSLTGNLLLIVIFSGYENFVSKLEGGDREDRPVWMGTVDFSGLKLKLISSIVAISAIALLRSFMKIGEAPLDEVPLQIECRLDATGGSRTSNRHEVDPLLFGN